jgi:hypothetical protein
VIIPRRVLPCGQQQRDGRLRRPSWLPRPAAASQASLQEAPLYPALGIPSWVARVGAPAAQEPLPGFCASKGRPETVAPAWVS